MALGIATAVYQTKLLGRDENALGNNLRNMLLISSILEATAAPKTPSSFIACGAYLQLPAVESNCQMPILYFLE